MGVYHLMGLGLSPGVVTGPISYLAKLYNNWEVEGKEFLPVQVKKSKEKKVIK